MASTPVVVRVRGFCHGCSREVVAQEVEEDEYSCPLCHEIGIVETPLEGFERWAGSWHAEYTDGSIWRFDISEAGVLRSSSTDDEEMDALAAQLECACSDALAAPEAVLEFAELPEPPQPYMLRARGHRPGAVTEYFRLEADGCLQIRRDCAESESHFGRAIRAHEAEEDGTDMDAVMQDGLFLGNDHMGISRAGLDLAMDYLSSANPSELGVAFTDFIQGFNEAMQQAGDASENTQQQSGARHDALAAAMENGFQRLANRNANGLSAGQRQAFTQQGANVSQMLADIMNQTFPLGNLHPMMGPPGAGHRSEQNRSAVPEALARSWVEEHAISEPPKVLTNTAAADSQKGTPASSSTCDSGEMDADEGWMCPICYLGAEDTEGLVLLCEGDGEAGGNAHVFHRDCATNWLSRQNSCPICRRSPVVPVPEATPAVGALHGNGLPTFFMGPMLHFPQFQPQQPAPE